MVIMEIQDLMAGDFVRYKKSKVAILIFEVDADKGVINNLSDGYCREVNINIDDIEPIPLTNKFFDKHGFISLYDEYPSFYFNKLEIRERELTAEGLCEYEINVGGISVLINYVHELQHILRLCFGIKNLNDLNIIKPI
jgi:hypothetical protein